MTSRKVLDSSAELNATQLNAIFDVAWAAKTLVSDREADETCKCDTCNLRRAVTKMNKVLGLD